MKTMPADPSGLMPLLDRQAVARLLGCSKRTVDNRIADQTLPYIKIGALVRFKRSDLEDYLRLNRVPSKDEIVR
jgi:excisionase family DNA binding protein